MKIKIKDATAFEGPAVQYTGDDGYPAAEIMPVLVAETADGRIFQLPNKFSVKADDQGWMYTEMRFSLYKAEEIASAVRQRGFINAEHWAQVTEEDMRDYLRGAYAA